MTAFRTRERETYDCGEVSMTKQSFKDECDVNVVVRNHAQTGMWSHLNPLNPTYGDYSLAINLQEAIALGQQADIDFAQLPAAVRAACNNNPVELLKHLADPAAAQVLIDLGLPLHEEPVPLDEQIAAGVAAGLAETPAGATPPGEEGEPKTVTPSS